MRGIPKEVREHIRFAADAINAHQRGLPLPTVALNYRYEPGQAEIFLRNVIKEYGENAVRLCCPGHAFSLVSPVDRAR